MKKLCLLSFTSFVLCNMLPLLVSGQCGSFFATTTPYESRCTATGSIKVHASGGSGNYKYKASGTVNTNFTSTDSITGLPAGTYTVTVTDITTNCSKVITNIIVPGTYQDPRFTLNKVDVSCDNGNNGSISLATQNFGRAPFSYSIIAPSPMGIGTTNATGTFSNLSSGIYTIRLMDSCGGIQTRLVTINNYTWKIDSVKFNKISCDSAAGYIRVSDNRGNISTITGLPGFTYGVIRSTGDTIWSSSPSFRFYLGSQNSFEAIVKDPCGKVKKFPVLVSFKPAVGNTVNSYGYTCRQFSANITGVANFFYPRFCLIDKYGVVIACNSTGTFTNINYGNYCIAAHDSCTDTTITRCFIVTAPPASVNNDVYISNKICAGFTASVTGQSGLTNPQYCLYDSANNLLGCNAAGVFNNLTYGSYCISIQDTCRDTTMQRCFNVRKPVPVIPLIIPPGYFTCNNFGVTVTGDSLTNPLFCLFDSTGQNIVCNNTGVFDSLRYGNYCVSVYDSCYDTTITRCFGVEGPQIINSYTSEISNRACRTFTATIFNSGIIGPQYCLYKSDSTLVACNSNGIFDSLAYGSYYIIAHSTCPDTSFTYNISAYPPAPALGANVDIGNRTCANFSASVNGQQNFTNPQYCLYNSVDSLLSCNSTGTFSNLAYGDYCIKVTDGCYDTLITRCFSAQPQPIDINVASRKSCNYGSAILDITVANGVSPFVVKITSPDGNELLTGTYAATTISIDNIPGLADGEVYTVTVMDNCGGADTAAAPVFPSVVSHLATVIPKCPSSTWLNGSGSIETTASSNTGSITTRIIKKDNATVSISPSNTSGAVSIFNNLGPGNYIIRYKLNDACNKVLYDTVVIPVYQYPSLDRSSAYQCDHMGFSIGAVVSNGVGPFLYEIIGSTPASPSIIAPPQPAPVFTISNGAAYSLVRLRAVDACGNASLEDASILPLANNGIISDYNCFQIATNLRVDTLYNSTYAWYKKHTVSDTDSTYLGSDYNVYLPYVTPEDTGLYVCHIVVNSGCISRTYYYRLDGSCFHYLPLTLQQFGGRYSNDHVALNWRVAVNADIKNFAVEKKAGSSFRPVGKIDVGIDPPPGKLYAFTDSLADPVANYYRLKMVLYNNTIKYSNTILVSRNIEKAVINVYPNPVYNVLWIELKQNFNHTYNIKLLNLMNQVIKETSIGSGNTGKISINRPKEAAAGIYVVKVTDLTDNTVFTQKIVFR